jgi:chemotaxis protein CheX
MPVLLVASESGRRQIENDLQQADVADILVTPLQPHVISRALSQYLGVQKPKPQSVDAGYVSPFVEGTVDTMKQMAQLECTRSNLSVKLDGKSSGDISGVMGLSGSAEGFVAVTFKNNLARKIVAKMLMANPPELTEDDIRDGVGEFMNMVAGAAKAQLVNTEHGFSLSLPTVIVGGPHSVGQPRGLPVICIEFATEGEKFEVLVCLHPKKKS